MFSKMPIETFLHVGWYRQSSTAKSYIFASLSNKGAKIRNRYNQVPHLTQDASSEVSVCLLVLSFYHAMWNADMKLEKQGM